MNKSDNEIRYSCDRIKKARAIIIDAIESKDRTPKKVVKPELESLLFYVENIEKNVEILQDDIESLNSRMKAQNETFILRLQAYQEGKLTLADLLSFFDAYLTLKQGA